MTFCSAMAPELSPPATMMSPATVAPVMLGRAEADALRRVGDRGSDREADGLIGQIVVADAEQLGEADAGRCRAGWCRR